VLTIDVLPQFGEQIQTVLLAFITDRAGLFCGDRPASLVQNSLFGAVNDGSNQPRPVAIVLGFHISATQEFWKRAVVHCPEVCSRSVTRVPCRFVTRHILLRYLHPLQHSSGAGNHSAPCFSITTALVLRFLRLVSSTAKP
jgi:hypothetical protein